MRSRPKIPPGQTALPGVSGAMHYSVVVVWLVTALVSLLNADGIAQQLLAQGGVHATHWQWSLIAAGAGWDLLVGLWLWWSPSRRSYQFALLGMLAMTVLATVWLPALWLHPLGPLTKNLPMAAILWHGMRAASVSHERNAI